MARRADTATTATWNRHAARYGAQEHLEITAVDAALRLAAPRPDERLVDLGTGSGLVLRRLAAGQRAAPREAIGVDRSTGMLAGVGALPAGWSTLVADGGTVPLPDGWADVVTCSYVLHLLGAQERAAVLAEARRLLAPRAGSRLVVVTVWSQRALVRVALALLARAWPLGCAGLRPLDPSADLASAGLRLTQRVDLPRHGYPSLVLVAQRDVRDLIA